MSYLQVQQKRQLEGMEEFWSVGVAQPSTEVDVWVCLQQCFHRLPTLVYSSADTASLWT